MRFVVIVVVVLCAAVIPACSQTATAPSAMPGSTGLSLQTLQGVVREANGGPLSDVQVTLVGTYESPKGSDFVPEATTNALGMFEIAPSDVICRNPQPGVLRFKRDGYDLAEVFAPGCSANPGAQPWTVAARLEPILTAVEGASLRTVLSNENLDHNSDEPGVSPCGPCISIRLPDSAGAALALTIEWSTSDPVVTWVDAVDSNWQERTVAEYRGQPGLSRIEAVIQANSAYFYDSVKVGLPVGSRAQGGFPAPVNVRVTVRRLN